jgi:hypothetical protein
MAEPVVAIDHSVAFDQCAATAEEDRPGTSDSARFTYPYRSAVSPSKSFVPRIISSARPWPTKCRRRSVPPPGCTPTPTWGWPSRVLSRDAKRMSQARTNSLLTPRTQPRIFAMLTTGDLVRRTNVSMRIGSPEGPTEVVSGRPPFSGSQRSTDLIGGSPESRSSISPLAAKDWSHNDSLS